MVAQEIGEALSHNAIPDFRVLGSYKGGPWTTLAYARTEDIAKVIVKALAKNGWAVTYNVLHGPPIDWDRH